MDNKPRKVWIAVLLSLVQPGLGQLYNGEFGKFLFIYILPLLLIPVMILWLCTNFIKLFLVFYVIFSIAYYVIVLIDAVKTSRRFSYKYLLKKYNKVIVYIGIFILSITISLVVEYNVMQSLNFPSQSMEPTLLVGDRILVDRSLFGRNPQKGDVIVFKYPKDPSVDFVERVVAAGGDTVEIKDKQLIVNSNVVNEKYVLHTDKFIYTASTTPRDNFWPIAIPAESYFVMGDNRDNSIDSRFYGPIPKTKVKGTVRGIFWSWDSENKSVRWNRIGLKVQ